MTITTTRRRVLTGMAGGTAAIATGAANAAIPATTNEDPALTLVRQHRAIVARTNTPGLMTDDEVEDEKLSEDEAEAEVAQSAPEDDNEPADKSRIGHKTADDNDNRS